MTNAFPTTAALSPKDQFIATFEREVAITLRIVRAIPDDKLDLRPHAKLKTARQLAWLLAREQAMLLTAVTTGFDWSKPPAKFPDAPATTAEIADSIEEGSRRLLDHLRATPEDKLPGTVSFFTGPRQAGDIPTMEFLWFMLFDQIHHRGQLSIYVRIADAKLPSIYGPTADEPWT